MDSSEPFEWIKRLLEDLFPAGWFEEPHDGHIAYQRWRLCNELIANSGALSSPTSKEQLLEVATLLLDSLLLVGVTQGLRESLQLGSWAEYGDSEFDRFRKSRLLGADSFPNLMVELRYGA